MKNKKFLIILFLYVFFAHGCKDSPTDVLDDHGFHIASLFAINGNTSVTLGWTEPENGVLARIELHRSSQNNFVPSSTTVYATLPSTATRFVDTAVTNESLYYYRAIPIEQVSNNSQRSGPPTNVAIGRPYDYSLISVINYSNHIQSIFNSGCAVSGCHAGSSEDQRNRVALYKILHGEEQFSLQSWENLIAGGPHGSIVVAFKASKSHLVFRLNIDTLIAPVSTPHMPRPGFNLPQEQIQTLIRWTNEGAANDFGTIPFTVHPRGKVLVTNQAEDLLCVIDIATNLVARYIQAGVPNVFTQPPHAPHSITVDKQKQFYYVCLIGAGKVLKYRASDNALLGEVSGIVSPSDLALTTSGDTAIVAQFFSTQNAIRMIDTRTMTLIGPPIAHPSLLQAHGMHRSRDGTMVYVTGYGSDNILILSLAGLSIRVVPLADDVPPIPIGPPRFQPYYVEPSRDDKYIYVSCSKSNEIRVIDRDSMKVIDSIQVGQEPLAVDITPDNSRLYVANLRSNSVSVIRTSDRSVITTIENVGVEPHGIKVSGDGNYVYVSCRNTGAIGDPPHHPTQGSKKPGIVAIIDASTNLVIKRLEVGAFAAGVAIVQ